MTQNANESAMTQTPKEGRLDLESSDWADVRLAIRIITNTQERLPKNRERALVITKLQEAHMWAGEAMMREPVEPATNG